jgi:putative ABC transport system ATP-binding protein
MIKVNNLKKSFGEGHQRIDILKGINFVIESSQTVALLGKSGSGKSTLLSLLSGLDRSDEGNILIDQVRILDFSESKLTDFRAKNFGIIFQQFHLFSTLTAFENVLLPLEILKIPDAKKRAESILESVGLSHRFDHLPSELSGGECQRVALARALAPRPKILFADEPSGNLDEETGEKVMDLLFNLVKENQTTLILVTHDTSLASRCERIVKLEHGSVVE